MGSTFELVFDKITGGHTADKFAFEVAHIDTSSVHFYTGGLGIGKIEPELYPDSIITITAGYYPAPCWVHVDIRDIMLLSDGNGNDTLFLANDAGISWGTPFEPGQAACGEGIWQWQYLGKSFQNGLDVTEFYGIGISEQQPDLIAGGCQDLNSMLLKEGNWINFGAGDGSEIVFDPVYPNIFYFSEWTGSVLFRTNNYGDSFSHFDNFHMSESCMFIPIELDPDDPSILYSGGKDLLKFFDVDDFLHEVEDPVELEHFSNVITDIEVIKNGVERRIYVATDKAYYPWTDPPDSLHYAGSVFLSSDNGNSFIDISDSLPGCFNGFVADIEVDPNNVSTIWVACVGFSKNTDQEKKVFKSLNSGTSWIEYSQGLPPGLPVFEIRYIQEFDILLAATDVGIFKYSSEDTAWMPYSNGLPLKIITDLEVNKEYNTIVASTFGRGIWKTPILCEYNETPWTIRENLEWDKDTILDCSIVIDENITVTLSHCKIFMPSDAKIVVKRGAELILDGCTLTSACNDLWWGIEVWGNSNYSQSSSVQGKIEVKNNSLIEKARKAIFCGKNIENTYPDWAYTGGIVDASESTFKNNHYGVQLWTYRNPQIMARFEACKFQTNQILADGSFPEYFMTLVQVNGVEIKGCHFYYEIEGVPDFRDHGRGIYAIDAGFEVMPDTNYNPCIFKDLDCGIFALKLYENKPLEVHESYFGDNLTGIYASAIEGLQIYLNEFDLNFDSIPASSQVFGGVYLDNCTGYKVEENKFGESNILGRFSPSIGITINNSGEAYNEIYLNTFGKLYIGTLVQNVNRSKDYDDGLKLNCNVFYENEYDVSVTGPTGCDECGISIWQGSSSVPAGNLFSQKGDHTTSDLDNHMREITYYHHKFIIGHDTADYPWVPRFYSDSVAPINVVAHAYDSTTCTSNLARSLKLESLRQFYFASKQARDSLSNELIILTDGGNTSALEMDITFAQPDDALELRDELLGYSPYLSDTILKKSAEIEDVLLPVMIKEIMVANPQSAKSDQVLQILEDRENELPEYMMAEIMEGKDSIAHKEMLESDLSFWNLQKEVAMNQLIHYYYKELSVTVHDSIISLLEEADNLQAKYRLIMAFLEKEDTILSHNILEGIPEQFILTASKILIHQHWTDFIELMNQVIQDSLKINELDSLQIESLIELSSFEDQPGSLARNYLDYLGFTEINPYYLLPENQLKSDREEKPLLKNLSFNKDPFVKIYPNPAKNYLIVEYDLGKEFSNATLRICSNEGKIMFHKSLDYQKHDMIINTRNWNQGIYLFSFILQNHQRQNGKFIISR